jgi:hypothetical protein
MLGRLPLAGLGPERGRGARGEGKAGRNQKQKKNPFLFLFQFFKAIFQKILKSILNLMQTTQYKISNAAA